MKVEEETRRRPAEIEIGGPLVFWITMLVIGLLAVLVFEPVFSNVQGVSALMKAISGWILYLPGSIILPLIVSIWIGERVGSSKGNAKSAAKAGEINAIYTTLIYVVSIFIIYMLIYYISPASLQSNSLVSYAEYAIAIPAVIVLVLTPLVSALSGARHSGA